MLCRGNFCLCKTSHRSIHLTNLQWTIKTRCMMLTEWRELDVNRPRDSSMLFSVQELIPSGRLFSKDQLCTTVCDSIIGLHLDRIIEFVWVVSFLMIRVPQRSFDDNNTLCWRQSTTHLVIRKCSADVGVDYFLLFIICVNLNADQTLVK